MAVVLQSMQQTDGDNPAYESHEMDEEQETNPDVVRVEITANGHSDNSYEDLDNENPWSKIVYHVQQIVYVGYRENKSAFWTAIYICLITLYSIYFAFAMHHKLGDEPSWRLLICTTLAVILIVLNVLWYLYKREIQNTYGRFIQPKTSSKGCSTAMNVVSWALIIGVTLFIVVFVIVDVAIYYPQNLIAVFGQALYILLFYIFSTNPAKVRWYPVFWGFALQYIFAIIILRWHYGYQAFKWLGDRVGEFLAYADEGAKFLYGGVFEEHFFAFKVLSIVVFFYSIINMLYYLGVMQALIRIIGRFLAFCMGTTAAESLNAAANIFVGMTEAPLLIKSFLPDMTKSELHAVMTGGFATIAGSVLGAFISFGVPANHLISASVMSAPAALAISKLACPETEISKASSKDFYRMEKPKERNIVEAASAGATASIKMVGGIAVNVLAFLSILKMVNATLIWFGERVGKDGFTFEFICSYVLFPVALFMGTEIPDCRKVAELIGIKTFINEFVAYLSLSTIIQNKVKLANYTSFFNETGDWFWINGNIVLLHTNETLTGGILSEKSTVIATYALCGFSNIGSMGILLGGLGALAPSKKTVLPKLVLRALVSGTVACFLTACIAGLLFKDY